MRRYEVHYVVGEHHEVWRLTATDPDDACYRVCLETDGCRVIKCVPVDSLETGAKA